MSIYLHHHHCHRITTNAVIDVLTTDVGETITEPITFLEMKAYLKVGYNEDDALITEMIKASRIWVERRCGVSVVAKTAEAILEVMNSQELPYGPVIGAVVVTNDITGDEVDDPVIVGLEGGFKSLQGYGRFKVEYTTGYAVCPEDLKLAIMAHVASSYEHRGDELDEANVDYARIAKAKSNPYRRTIGF